jgi:hypothetical protein
MMSVGDSTILGNEAAKDFTPSRASREMIGLVFWA